MFVHLQWLRQRSVRSWRTLVLVAVVALTASTGPLAQSTPQPTFEPVGLQPGRAYFGQLPFESVDMINGNVILTFTDLALPGDAGMDLRLTRTYNHQELGRKWNFGLAGVPMRIGLPAGNGSQCCDNPELIMADGSARRTRPLNSVFNDTVFITDDFWRYTTTTRTLEMPNGWTATYEAGNPPGGVMLLEVEDLYGNKLTPDWEAAVPQDIRPLRLESVTQTVSGGTRTVSFTYDSLFSACGPTPRKMIYAGREWNYDCEYGNPLDQSGGRLTTVTPPVGPGWTFSYVNGFGGALTVTTPAGGWVTYDFDDLVLPFYNGVGRSVLRQRRTGGRDIPAGTWSFDYSLLDTPGDPVGTVTLPDGRELEFEHVGTAFSSQLFLKNKVLRAAGTGTVRARVHRDYIDLPHRANFPSVTVPALSQETITQDGLTYTTTYEYLSANFAEFHHPWRITEQGQATRVTTRVYDYNFTPYLLNRLQSETVTVAGESFTTDYAYEDATGFLESQTTYGVTTTFRRDARGNRDRTTDANGNITTFTNESGTLKDTYTPEYAVNRGINPDGTVAWEERGGFTTNFTYDTLGRIRNVAPPGVTNAVTDYDPAGAWIKSTRGPSYTWTYLDGFGRPIGTLDAAGVRTSTEYDADGRVKFEGQPYTGSTPRGDTLTYDDLGRLKRRTHKDLSFVQYQYNGSLVTITDEEGHSTVQTWSAFGNPSDARLVGVRDARLKNWGYEYNALGMLTRVLPPDNGAHRLWHYNTKNFLDSETHPESGTSTYTHWPAGNVKRKINSRGRPFDYLYDGNNRLRHINAPDSNDDDVTVTYVGENRTGVANGYVQTSFAYDSTDRLIGRTDIVDGKTFTVGLDYDGLDNLVKVTYPNNRQVAYDVHPGNGIQIRKVFEPGGTVFADQIAYDASGGLASYVAGNGQTESITYDSRARPDLLDSGPLHLNYDYDHAGNVTLITDARAQFTQNFDYDAVDRLKHVYGSFGAATFDYDAHGNRTQKNDVTYHYSSATNRLESVTGGFEAAAYTYNELGNLETGPSTLFNYTRFDMLESYSVTNVAPAPVTTYRYDGDNVRVQRIGPHGDTEYMIHGPAGQLLAEYEKAGSAARWVRDYVRLGSKLIATVSAPQPVLSFQSAASSIPEPGGLGHFVSINVTLTTPDGLPLGHAVGATYATANGTAVAGSDYQAVTSTVGFPIGAASGSTLSFIVNIVDDTVTESHEQFTVTLSSPSGAEIGVATHTVTIVDNEPQLLLSIDAPAANAVRFTPFNVGGWAIDARAATGTGVDAVALYAQPVAGGAPILLGNATYGGARSDIAQTYGAQFLLSGYNGTVTTLAPGVYDLYGAAHMTANNSIQSSAFRRITVEPSEGMSIDAPQNGAQLGQAFTLSGWAIDREAATGTGVNQVRVTAVPTAGGSPIALGLAAYGGERPDIATVFGERFRMSAFFLSITTLPLGTYRLDVEARSTVTGTFSYLRSVTITVRSDPRMSLDAPLHGSTVGQPFVIGGWAVDLASATGTGVDAIHVWAINSAGAGTFLGAAPYGGARADLAAVLGERFRHCGFTMTATGLAPGTYQIIAYAHSTVTGTFNLSQGATITIPTPNVMVAIDMPSVNQTVGQPFTIAGWAVDFAHPTASGVSAIWIWAEPAGGGAAIPLGSVLTGGSRPDVGAIHGARFTPSGWGGSVSGLPAGTYTLKLYPYSTVTDSIQAPTARVIHVQ